MKRYQMPLIIREMQIKTSVRYNFILLRIVILFFWLSWVFTVTCRLSCPTACGILVPQPGIKPESPALEGGFLTPRPQGSL